MSRSKQARRNRQARTMRMVREVFPVGAQMYARQVKDKLVDAYGVKNSFIPSSPEAMGWHLKKDDGFTKIEVSLRHYMWRRDE